MNKEINSSTKLVVVEQGVGALPEFVAEVLGLCPQSTASDHDHETVLWTDLRLGH